VKNKCRSSLTVNRIFLTLAASSFVAAVGGISGCSHNEMEKPSSDDAAPQAAAGTDQVPPTADATPDANASATPAADASSTPDTTAQATPDGGPTLASTNEDSEASPAPKHHKRHREPSAAPAEAVAAEPAPAATPFAAQPSPVATVVTPPPAAMTAVTPPPAQQVPPPPSRAAYTPPPAAEAQEEEPFYKKKSILLVGVLGILGIIGVFGFGRRKG
jgi:hypothetical protein